MQPVKPGWQTTEFWLHGGMQIISLLVVIGFVNAGDGTALSDSWAKSVGAAATLITNLIGFYMYIKSRTAVKVAASNAAPAGNMSPTSFQGNAGWLIAVTLGLCAAPAFAQAPLKVTDRPPIVTTASNSTPPYFLPWRAWMHGQLNNQAAPAPQQPIIINQPQPAAPAAPATDPTVVALLQQQVQLHQQQVFLQQQIASLMAAGVNHLSTPTPIAPPVPPPIYYPAPQGVQPFPSAPSAPVQPLPIAPQYPVQPLPVVPLYPVQPLPIAPITPPQPLPIAPPVAPQVLPVAPIVGPQPAPKASPQSLPIGPFGTMPPASSYNRFTTVTHALCAPVK